MSFRVGINIKEGEKILLFGYLVTRDIAIDNFCKNTGHGFNVWLIYLLVFTCCGSKIKNPFLKIQKRINMPRDKVVTPS
jgi:hypothetical protein